MASEPDPWYFHWTARLLLPLLVYAHAFVSIPSAGALLGAGSTSLGIGLAVMAFVEIVGIPVYWAHINERHLRAGGRLLEGPFRVFSAEGQ